MFRIFRSSIRGYRLGRLFSFTTLLLVFIAIFLLISYFVKTEKHPKLAKAHFICFLVSFLCCFASYFLPIKMIYYVIIFVIGLAFFFFQLCLYDIEKGETPIKTILYGIFLSGYFLFVGYYYPDSYDYGRDDYIERMLIPHSNITVILDSSETTSVAPQRVESALYADTLLESFESLALPDTIETWMEFKRGSR